jgi:tripeptide aminopeptidase
MYEPMNVADDAAVLRLLRIAAERVGRPLHCARMGGGGCDANILNQRGFEVVNLGTGMRDIHTTREWLRISDMVSAAEVTVSALTLAGESG